MIESAFLLLRDELQAYLLTKDPSANIIIDNIAMVGTSSADSLSNSIVLTLVYIEDQNLLNIWSQITRFFGSGSTPGHTPQLLNLYMLFTCNYSGSDYPLALRRLDHILQFVQNKTVFSTASLSGGTTGNTTINRNFILEFFNLTLKKTHQLWGSLGGRQVPFALFKLKFLPAA